MYEKNIYDWDIIEQEYFKKNGFNIYIGTYSNNYLSIVDCLSLLQLADSRNEKDFLNYLEKQNNLKNWFSNKEKDKHISFIKKWGINPYCFFNIDDFIMNETDFLYSNEDIKEDDYISEEKIKSYIDSKENHKDLIEAIKKSESITELYKLILEIKFNISEHIYCNVFDFVTKEK